MELRSARAAESTACSRAESTVTKTRSRSFGLTNLDAFEASWQSATKCKYEFNVISVGSPFMDAYVVNTE